MKASVLSFRAAVAAAVAGMVWGIQMGIGGDHSAFPAHAHFNLLGWVSLFLFGIYYHLHPELDRTRLALIQVWFWIAATLVLTTGVTLISFGRPGGEPIAAAGSLAAIAAMLLFAWFVYRPQREDT